jgi:hypothetical protein
MSKPQFPIGNANFGDIRKLGLVFVDKSLLIRDLLQDIGAKVIVITRPRRFGKTLNLSMIQHFFSPEVYGIKTQRLFDGLKISQDPACMALQGKIPVIFISFKDLKEYHGGYEEFCIQFKSTIQFLYLEHQYLLNNPKLTATDREQFIRLAGKNADLADVRTSINNLARLIYLDSGVKPWLLIDEYDTPIQASYVGECYQEVIDLMRGFYGTTLKDNPFVEKTVITGILRIAKESLFSGVNNLEVYSLMRNHYGQYFGFTEDEVAGLLTIAGMQDKEKEIRHWYNGYQIGETTIYNPWSIVNCLKRQGEFLPYWVNTSENTLIKQLLARATPKFKMLIENLINGEEIPAQIEENTAFGELQTNTESIWSLLLFSGYLKVNHVKQREGTYDCQLKIPNHELMLMYQKTIKGWISDRIGYIAYEQLLKYLVTGNIEEFGYILQDYLMESMSLFDVKGTHPENFYHGFVMGLMVALRETHLIKSNRESGFGRYDVMIIPKDQTKLGLVIEFKTVGLNDNIDVIAQNALAQIKDKNYVAELKQAGIQNILQLAMVFQGKIMKILSEPA